MKKNGFRNKCGMTRVMWNGKGNVRITSSGERVSEIEIGFSGRWENKNRAGF